MNTENKDLIDEPIKATLYVSAETTTKPEPVPMDRPALATAVKRLVVIRTDALRLRR